MKSVFISSTFKDMQAERDMLHERIFPRLRRLIGEYGEDIQELDLRWGVDTVSMSEEESSHQVLKVCIDAIDRCRPYIIVLLGERYGWIPGREVVGTLQDARVDAWYEEQMSITNLEIRYGALSEEETLKNCVFCFRDPGVIADIDEEHRPLYQAESPLHREKLQALKEQIRSRKEAVILEYGAGWDSQAQKVCGLEDFGEALYEKLAEMIRRDFAGQGVRSEGERMKRLMERMSEQYRSSYVNRYREEWYLLGSTLLNRPSKYHLISQSNMKRCLIKGEGGSGKSALMASVEYASRMAGCETILYFSGAFGCQSMDALKKYVIYRLEEICALPHEETASQDGHLRFLAGQAEEKCVCCFIDGLDQLFCGDEDGRLELLELCPNFYYVLSTLSEDPAEERIKDYIWDFNTLYLEDLTMAERRQLVAKTAAKRGKKLDDAIVQMTVAEPGAGSPLYLSMLLQRYFMMDQQEFEAAERIAPGMEGLHRYMEQLLQEMPDGVEEMASYLLAVTGERFGLTWFQEILQLMVLSEYGLSERELEGLLAEGGMRFRQVEFQQLASYLYDAFALREDGKWILSQRLFQEAVAGSITEKERTAAGELFIRYSQKEPEFLEREGFLYILRQRHEAGRLVLEQAGDWETKNQVLDLVGREAARDADSRRYYLELAGKARPDSQCEFWLSFEPRNYEPVFEDFLEEIWKALLARDDIPARQKGNCAFRLARYYARKEAGREAAFRCFGEAEELYRRLPEPEKSRELSRVLYERAWRRMQYSSGAEWEKAEEEFNRVQALLESLLQTADEKERREILSLKLSCRADQAWSFNRYLGTSPQQVLEECRKELSAAGGGDYGKESWDKGLANLETSICYDLTDIYTRRDSFDAKKALERGQRALQLSEWLAQREPSADHLRLRMTSLERYTWCFEPGYQYPYWEEYVFLARKLYRTYPTDYWKERLAWGACSFGTAVDSAVMDRSGEVFPDELWEKGEKSWEEGLSLYEEWVKKGCEGGIRRQYELFLGKKAEVDLKQGYRRDAYEKAARSRELLLGDLSGEAPVAGTDLRLLSSDLILAKALCEVCHAKEALPYIEEALQMAAAYQKRKGKEYAGLAEVLLLHGRILYYLRRDEEALAACRRAQEAYDSLAGEGTDAAAAALGELAYIRSRIFLEQGRVQEAERCRQTFASLCAQKKGSWEYGRNLLLQGDLLLAREELKEAQAVYTEAEEFWRDRNRTERSQAQKRKRYQVQRRGDYIYRERCMSESGQTMRSAYYLLYSLYQLRQMTGTWDGPLASVLGDVAGEYGDDCRIYGEWLYLPAKLEAFAKLTDRVPQGIKEKWLEEECPMPPQVGFEEQLWHIPGQEKAEPVPALEMLQGIIDLMERIDKSYWDFQKRTETGRRIAALFQLPQEGEAEWAAVSREQRELFAGKGQAERVWYPLLELLALVWHHRQQLSAEELDLLYQKVEICLSRANTEGEEQAAYGWELSSLSEEVLAMVVASGDEKKWYSLRPFSCNVKNAFVLELYRRTGDWEQIRCRLEELSALLAYLEERDRYRDRSHSLLPDDRVEMRENIIVFLCQLLEMEDTRDARKAAAFLWEHQVVQGISDGGLIARLRAAFTAAAKPRSGSWDIGFLEQVEEFFQAGYRTKWERIQEQISERA